MRNYLYILLLIFFSGCGEDDAEKLSPWSYIPEESGLILQLQNPDLFYTRLKNNIIVQQALESKKYKGLFEQLIILNKVSTPALIAFADGKEQPEFLLVTEPKSLRDSLSEESTGSDKLHYKNQKYFVHKSDQFLILSNTKSFLQASVSSKNLLPFEKGLHLVQKAASDSEPVVFINHKNFGKQLLSSFPNLKNTRWSDWTQLDMDLQNHMLDMSGVSVAQDSVDSLLQHLDPEALVENELAAIAPVTSSFYSFSTAVPGGETSNPFLSDLASPTEGGYIDLHEAGVFALKNDQFRFEGLTTDQAQDFLGVRITAFQDLSEIEKLFSSKFEVPKLEYQAYLSPYLLFSENEAALKKLISAHKTGKVFGKDEAYLEMAEQLSQKSSLLHATIEKTSQENPFLTVKQLVGEGKYAFVRVLIKAAVAGNEPVEDASDPISVELDAAVATEPVFFKNHRSNGLDIAVQDEENALYLISPQGQVYWKKKLDSRILGGIHSIDAFRNGRYQLAFSTSNKIHVIDRDGNNVKPFPIDLEDPITQPLAVFDYDGNRKYRLVVVQEEEILMLNADGKRVKGFDFDGSSSGIARPPKHLRLGKKDYLLVSGENKKLYILNRRGDIRVPLEENLEVSDKAWFENAGQFVGLDADNIMVRIDQEGKITRKNEDSKIEELSATEELLVLLSQNNLFINEKAVALDFGLYDAPQIFNTSRGTFVGITNLQENKVYVLNSNGEILEGFPVYGSSGIDLDNLDEDSALELVVQGGENSILIYQLAN